TFARYRWRSIRTASGSRWRQCSRSRPPFSSTHTGNAGSETRGTSMTTTSAAGAGFARLEAQLDEIQAALRELGLDGWLLYDLHARNAVSGRLLGLGDLTRRYFVLIPAEGEPVAVVHGIE